MPITSLVTGIIILTIFIIAIAAIDKYVSDEVISLNAQIDAIIRENMKLEKKCKELEYKINSLEDDNK